MADQMMLTAEERDRRTNPRRVRAQGKIPAVCYGAGQKDILLAISPKEFAAVMKQKGHLITLKMTGGEERKVVLREVQRHPIRRDVPVHVDFLAVRLDKPMRIDVPLILSGNPIGVKMGGVLQQVRRTILVECLPADIPPQITHDVSALDIGGSVHVADLVLPQGVKALFTDNFTVANCSVITEGKAPAAEEAAGATAEKKADEKKADEKKK